MRIAYAGAEGAFAHEACLAFARGCDPVPLPSFGAVVAAVEEGAAERGMLPVRNSRAGEVAEVAALLGEARVAIVEQHELPVRMHLLTVSGAELSDLKVVTSHPVALRQCAGSLERLSLATRPAENTALAARALREPSVGVLASEAAAAIYGLQILKEDMQDDPENRTTFVIIQAN